MAGLNAEFRLLKEYSDELQAMVGKNPSSSVEDGETQKRFDAKLVIYQKQIAIAQAIDPEVAIVHQSNLLYLKAQRTWDASIVGNRFKSYSKKALGILDEGLALYDSARIHFLKAQILAALDRKQDAISELKLIIENVQQSEDIYISARKYLADLENPPKKGPCFVATACYGSYDHPDVKVLRAWRDRHLLETSSGRQFVAWYYKVGPDLARRTEGRGFLQGIIRSLVIKPFARHLRKAGFGPMGHK